MNPPDLAVADVRLERTGPVATLVIANPRKFNAMTLGMWATLSRHLQQLADDRDLRVLVVRGEDGSFMSGVDTSEFEAQRNSAAAQQDYSAAVLDGFLRLLAFPRPTVASILGPCFGGGLSLASACDIRLGGEGAKFRMPAARIGLGYGPQGMTRLVQLLGEALTADLFFTGRTWSAPEAHRAGFLHQLHADGALPAATDDYVRLVAANAPLSIAAGKRTLVELRRPPAERDLPSLQALVDACYDSDDYREGRRALAEKRAPVFTGR